MIWNHAVPEEVGTQVMDTGPFGAGPFSLPVNPMVSILLICQHVNREVRTIPQPILTAYARCPPRGSSLVSRSLAIMASIRRVKITSGLLHSRKPTHAPAEMRKKTSKLQSHLAEHFAVVKAVSSEFTGKHTIVEFIGGKISMPEFEVCFDVCSPI